MQQLGSHWKNFHEIWYFSIFRKSADQIQVSLESDKNGGTLHKDRYKYIYEKNLVELFLNWEMLQTKFVEKSGRVFYVE
jgi:hypothetical protein